MRHSSTIVIVATLNEEEGVGPTIAEIKEFVDKPFFLVVDGRSVDGTVKIAESMGARIVVQKGIGKGDAVAAAIGHVRAFDAKYAILVDADYTYPAEYLPSMIDVLEENPDVGMVCGNRFAQKLRPEAMLDAFFLGNRFLAFTHNFLNGVALQDPLTGLRVVRWEILKNWRPKSKGFDIEVELNHHVEREGYGIQEIPITYRPRLGEKKLKLRHGFGILKRILLEGP